GRRHTISKRDWSSDVCSSDLMFCPEYQETLHENTPAHIFNHSIEGVGYRYRQCFAGGAVDWAEYDAAFLRADATEPPAALCRVRSEEHTSELQSRFDLVRRLL